MNTVAQPKGSRAPSTSRRAPAPGLVDLWKLPLELPVRLAGEMRELISADERARAARFRHERDAKRFVAGRGQLRRVLGHYLDLDPSRVAFSYGRFGRPSLADPAVRPPLDFNLAHSDGLALLAVTGGAAVGVDLERARPGFGGIDIARQFFAPGELRQLLALPEARREAAFLRCWTRKEAYVKAHGAGLQMALDSFEVPLSSARVQRLRWSRVPREVDRWSLLDVSALVAGYQAALVVAGNVRVRERSWDVEAGNA